MSLLQQFKEKVLSSEAQFELLDGGKTLYFVKFKKGKVTCIFSGYHYHGFNFDNKLSICAIVSDDNIYLVDTFMFRTFEVNEEYPLNVFSFSDKLKEVNELIKNKLFPQFYNSLPIRELSEDELDRVKRDTRGAIIQGNSIIAEPKIENVVDNETFAKVLYGETTIDDCANNFFEKNKESFIRWKSENHELQKLIESKYNVEDWEIELAKSLKELNAKTVTIEFEYNDQLATAKVEKDSLLRMINNNDYFSSYNFENSKRGEELLEKLDVGTWKGHEKGVLECKHIVSIKYGKKIVYSKSENSNIVQKII